ncbi:MAG: DmsC/YnfH family molybdoenzyme membrane anchor subunit [Luteolibacter sp.]
MISLDTVAPESKCGTVGLSDEGNLIDKLLNDQKTLQTPIARFSDAHDRGTIRTDIFKHLIPLEKPKAGEQYAFQVELDRCTGCKACVVACHTLNGLDEDESWRDIGMLEGGDDQPGFQQTVTAACHHCVEPECMHGCPVGAYEKDEETGIVRHLDDQCIGCEYCSLKCPYDVPKYSHKRGIVRKCDMCHQRLEVGEAPACVQACPTEAISIIKVESAPLREKNDFLTGLNSPRVTLPTTRYVGREVPSGAHLNVRPKLIPEPAHWPLALMLVLTQTGLGILAVSLFKEHIAFALTGFVIFNLGMVAATLHLGKPLKAWRFFLGLRTSWLSREILAFSMLAPIPGLLALVALFPDLPFVPAFAVTAAKLSLIPMSIAAVFTSVMIYHDTKRKTWDLRPTSLAFYTTLFSFFLVFLSPWAFALLMILSLAFEGNLLRAASDAIWSPSLHQARLRLGPLRMITIARYCTAGLAIILAFINPWLAAPVLLASELLSRHLFFTSVSRTI